MKKITMFLKVWFLNGKVIEVAINDNFEIEVVGNKLKYVPMVSVDWFMATIDLDTVSAYSIKTGTLY